MTYATRACAVLSSFLESTSTPLCEHMDLPRTSIVGPSGGSPLQVAHDREEDRFLSLSAFSQLQPAATGESLELTVRAYETRVGSLSRISNPKPANRFNSSSLSFFTAQISKWRGLELATYAKRAASEAGSASQSFQCD